MPRLKNYRILAIDPGTKHTGVSIMDMSVDDKIHVIFIETIHSEKLVHRYQDVIHVHGLKYAKIIAIGVQLRHLLELYAPDIVVSEAPYYKSFPAPFAALTEVVSMIRQCVYTYDSSMPFLTIDPSTVKLNMGVKGTSGDKDQMRTALIKLGLSYESYLDPLLIDEHSVDSICVGLTLCNKIQ